MVSVAPFADNVPSALASASQSTPLVYVVSARIVRSVVHVRRAKNPDAPAVPMANSALVSVRMTRTFEPLRTPETTTGTDTPPESSYTSSDPAAAPFTKLIAPLVWSLVNLVPTSSVEALSVTVLAAKATTATAVASTTTS